MKRNNIDKRYILLKYLYFDSFCCIVTNRKLCYERIVEYIDRKKKMSTENTEYKTCELCDGSGVSDADLDTCWSCGGSGKVKKPDPTMRLDEPDEEESEFITCHRCEEKIHRDDIIPNTECCFGCHELFLMKETGHGVVTSEGLGLLGLDGKTYRMK